MTKAIKISVFPFVAVFCQIGISFSRETLERLIYYFKNNKKNVYKPEFLLSWSCEFTVLLQDIWMSNAQWPGHTGRVTPGNNSSDIKRFACLHWLSMCSGPGLHAHFSSLCELCFGIRFLTRAVLLNSLLHRWGDWAKSSILLRNRTPLCVHWKDRGINPMQSCLQGCEPEPCSDLVHFWALLTLLTQTTVPTRCFLGKGLATLEKYQSRKSNLASYLLGDRAQVCLLFRHLDHLSQEPSLAYEKATRQLWSWLNPMWFRFTLIKFCKMSSFHKLTQIRFFAGAPEPSLILWARSLCFDHSRHIRISTPEDKKSNRFREDLSDIGLMKSKHMRASHN